jgi:hypothetical protein
MNHEVGLNAAAVIYNKNGRHKIYLHDVGNTFPVAKR